LDDVFNETGAGEAVNVVSADSLRENENATLIFFFLRGGGDDRVAALKKAFHRKGHVGGLQLRNLTAAGEK